MGLYTGGPANPPVMEGGFRNPIPPPDDTCKCATIRLAPGFLKPLVRILFGPSCADIISEKHLHPNVEFMINSLLKLQDTVADATAQNGMRTHIEFSTPERVGDDFKCGLTMRCDGEEIFAGRFTAFGVWNRGKVSFGHAVVGAIELLYLHFLEMGSRNESLVDMKFGILELSGKATGLPTVNGMTMNEISTALRQQQDDPGGGTCVPIGPFDPLALYGAFPSSGFSYFHGVKGELVEERLKD